MSGSTAQLVIPLLILVIFGAALFIPERNRRKKHDALISSLKTGDTVITSAGIIGRIKKIDEEDNYIIVESEGTRIKILRQYIGQVVERSEEADSLKEEEVVTQDEA